MTELPAVQPKKTRPRADQLVGDIRRQILLYGLRVDWQMAVECPCVQLTSMSGLSRTISGLTHERQADCPACGGNGWVFHSRQEIRALCLTGTGSVDQNLQMGLLQQGECRFTFLAEQLPGYMHRLTLLDTVIPFTDFRERDTAGAVDTLRYPAVTRTLLLGSGADPTEGVATSVDVAAIYKADSKGSIVVDAAGDPLKLISGTHFSVNGSGNIDWTLGLAVSTAAGDYTFDATARTITRAAGDWVADGWEVGMHVTVAGATDTDNNGSYTILTVTTLVITIAVGETLTDYSNDLTASFSGGFAPAPSTRFTIQYFTNPVFRLTESPFSFRDTWTQVKSPTPSHKAAVVRSLGRLEWLGEP